MQPVGRLIEQIVQLIVVNLEVTAPHIDALPVALYVLYLVKKVTQRMDQDTLVTFHLSGWATQLGQVHIVEVVTFLVRNFGIFVCSDVQDGVICWGTVENFFALDSGHGFFALDVRAGGRSLAKD